MPLFWSLIWLSKRLSGPLPHLPSMCCICPCVCCCQKCCQIPLYQGGEVRQFTPVWRCLDSATPATADACAPLPNTTEVTPILVPLQKFAPQGIGNGSTAAIHASINAAALANSGNNNVEYSPYWQGSWGRDTMMMMMTACHHWNDNNQPMMRNIN